jgi:hypothetical protein
VHDHGTDHTDSAHGVAEQDAVNAVLAGCDYGVISKNAVSPW